MSSSPSPSSTPDTSEPRAAKRGHFAIIGAGPTGLEAALAVAEHGYSFTLYEAAPRIAGHVHRWRHVRLFTPWSMNVSPRMRRALEAIGHSVPDEDHCPTGAELIDELFEPLASAPPLADHLALGTQVLSIGRQGLLKHDEIGTGFRADRPFRLLLRDRDGHERVESADIVLDCSGNTEPNSLGDGGIPAPGERALARFISRDVPDLDAEPEPYAGRTTLLVGAGHSARTALRDFGRLVERHPETRLVWVTRAPQQAGPIDDDPLPERRDLDARARDLATSPPDWLKLRQGYAVDALAEDGKQVTVTLRDRDGNPERLNVDRVLSLTGKVGNHMLYRQLQVHECYATSGPMKLAAALLSSSGAGGDCLAQTSLGPETLRSPEPGFFILGSKSYGRRNDFLMKVGWQQVEEILHLLD